MSNNWRLYCATCREESGDRWNHNPEAARAVAARAKRIGQALRLLGAFPDDVMTEITIRVGAQDLDKDFLFAHGDHDVRIATEYGQVYCADGTLDRQHSQRDEQMISIKEASADA